MPEEAGHWKRFSKFAAPWGVGHRWGIWNCIAKLLLFLLGTVLKNHHVFHSVFCTSMARVSLPVLDMVTTQPPVFIIKLGKIADVLQLRCHQ